MDNMLTVAIPVGPKAAHCAFLEDTLISCYEQTVAVQVLLVDDMHGLVHPFEGRQDGQCQFLAGMPQRYGQFIRDSVSIHYAPWRLGIPHAFNFGVALAPTDIVIMLGADDTLEPDAAESVLRQMKEDGQELAERTYYGLPVRYMDTREEQYLPCNEAAVTKQLWRATGGFPPESAVGACDAAYLSSIWNSDYFKIKMVGNKPLCNYRRHSATDTATRSVAWQGPILEVRNLLTPLVEPQWGRYE